MKFLRHALFALLLLLAQSGALTHAADHLRPDADSAPHLCALCLAAHSLAAPFASTPASIALCTADFALPESDSVPVFSPSAVSPRARAPPFA